MDLVPLYTLLFFPSSGKGTPLDIGKPIFRSVSLKFSKTDDKFIYCQNWIIDGVLIILLYVIK